MGADAKLKWGTAAGQYIVGGLWQRPNRSADGDAYGGETISLRTCERVPDAQPNSLLRDPVERTRSYQHMAVLDRWDERLSGRAIDERLRPDAREEGRTQPRETVGYVTWREYGRILAGYSGVLLASRCS